MQPHLRFRSSTTSSGVSAPHRGARPFESVGLGVKEASSPWLKRAGNLLVCSALLSNLANLAVLWRAGQTTQMKRSWFCNVGASTAEACIGPSYPPVFHRHMPGVRWNSIRSTGHLIHDEAGELHRVAVDDGVRRASYHCQT